MTGPAHLDKALSTNHVREAKITIINKPSEASINLCRCRLHVGSYMFIVSRRIPDGATPAFPHSLPHSSADGRPSLTAHLSCSAWPALSLSEVLGAELTFFS